MKQLKSWILLFALVVAWGAVQAQEEGGDAEMAAMMKLATPGEHHEHLHKLVGKWKAQGTFWMQPGAPPTESEGFADISSMLGGRFIRTDFSGDFQGMKFTGFGLDGYDNAASKHIGMWIDTMGTMMMTYEGGCSDGGKVMTMMTEFDDPSSGARIKMRGVTTMQSEDKFTYEAYMGMPDGTEFKGMEIVYTKQ